MRKIALVVAVAGLLAAPATQAKTVATLNVTQAAASFTFSGCGYTKLTTIIVWHNYTGPYQEVTPDANGCVQATFSNWGPGSYVAQSWQKQGNGWNETAEVDFTVA
jgi:hypothetical protein